MPTGANACGAAELLMRQQTGAAGLIRSPTVDHRSMLPLGLASGLFVMDRRRSVALILGLLLCLALLGSWFVGVDKEDAATAQAPVAAPSSTPKPTTEIVQVPRQDPKAGGTVSYQAPIGPGVFRGRVIDAVSREPIREFTVELRQWRPRAQPAPQVKRTFRTKDGRFVYRGLPTGTWTILTTAAGYQRFDIPDVPISDSESTQELLIPMRAGVSLRGRVVDEITGDGIASATIRFREASVGRYEDNFRLRPSERSQKDGSFVLQGVPPGGVRLEVSANNYAAREMETFVSSKTPPMEIALAKGGTIAGYLAGIDGLTPVSGEVSLVALDENNGAARNTGPAGEFSFDQLTAGRYQLTGRGAGLNGRREITLSHNERLEGIVLPMTAGYSIRGVISGLRPDERTETIVVVNAIRTHADGMAHQVNLNERGAYEVNGVAPGLVSIEVIATRRGRLQKSLEMPANSDLVVDFGYKTNARLAGRVTRGGQPLAGVTLSASVATAEEAHLMQSTVTSNSGDYVLGDMPAGDYMLTVESYNTPNVRVSGDTVFDFDVPESQVAGRVYEDGGKVPVVGATINVRSVQQAPRTNSLGGRSDHFGQFNIRGLQPGDFVLSAYKPGYELYRAPLSYSSPVKDMAISMRRAPGVEIRVREADSNRPLSNIIVLEILNGTPSFGMQLQADQNGVSYLPSGLAGSSLRIGAWGYGVVHVNDWNGQQLDLSLQKQPSR